MTLKALRVIVLVGAAAAVGCAAQTAQTSPALSARSDVHERQQLAANTANTDVVPQRLGAQALGAAESRACEGIPSAERASSAFAQTQITRVAPLYETVAELKMSWNELRGSTVHLLASRGMTKQWLTRLLQCEMARYASHGTVDPKNPLLLGPVEVSVEDTATGFVLSIRTQRADKALAERVLQSSISLLQQSSQI